MCIQHQDQWRTRSSSRRWRKHFAADNCKAAAFHESVDGECTTRHAQRKVWMYTGGTQWRLRKNTSGRYSQVEEERDDEHIIPASPKR